MIQHPEEMNRETLYDLRALLALYPYYQTARLLMLKNLYLLHDPSFDEELRRAAIYITDRKIIFEMVEAAHYQIKPDPSEVDLNQLKESERKETGAEKHGDRTSDLIDHFLGSIPMDAEEEEKKKKEKEANKKVEKSLLVIHIKPFDEETNLKALFEKIRGTEVKGCKWGETCNIKPLAFGINFLEISCVIEDDVCSEDDVIDAIMQFEDEVQSTETVSFNKIS